jgi:hypothetical protein
VVGLQMLFFGQAILEHGFQDAAANILAKNLV